MMTFLPMTLPAQHPNIWARRWLHTVFFSFTVSIKKNDKDWAEEPTMALGIQLRIVRQGCQLFSLVWSENN